jgi:hypothetical protein
MLHERLNHAHDGVDPYPPTKPPTPLAKLSNHTLRILSPRLEVAGSKWVWAGQRLGALRSARLAILATQLIDDDRVERRVVVSGG